ncbi:hypothetical protein CBER1_06953 [Cercospora berteroae]|uniref:Uncharacterized protein n=1 Tax=Cercospora berteroae TaxID=357750 RepID=A0A2S6C3Y5_9PEZI|nr:hypothetical protein CBER1_06953 [Cercospora berteroae]
MGKKKKKPPPDGAGSVGCGKYEPGCDSETDNAKPFFWNGDKITHPHRFQTTVRRWKSRDHFACGGDKIGGDVRVTKLECHTFKEPPDVAAGVNYFLPADSNVANNCEIRAWDHKDCEKGKGKLVFHVPGANSTEAYVAQRFCHTASYIKSFMVGPCLGHFSEPEIDG